MWKYTYTDELYHHGVKGQRWGFRRYQNKDGSLTPAGRRRINKLKEEYTQLTGKRLVKQPTKAIAKTSGNNNKKKDVKDMSNEELRTLTDRLNAEKNYIDAVNNRKAVDTQVSKGQKLVNKVLTDVVSPVATDVTKQLFKSYVVKGVNKGLNLENEYKLYTNNKKKN